MVSPFQHTAAGLKYNPSAVKMQADELVAFGQGNVEAFVKSAQIWAAGAQDLGRSVAATAQTQFAATMASAKAAAVAKSPKELLDLQTAFVRKSVEKAVAETTTLTNASRKLVEEAFAPIAARVKLATETFGRLA